MATIESPAKRARTEERTFLVRSKSVDKGHPDKLCDQASDAVPDACLQEDPRSKGKSMSSRWRNQQRQAESTDKQEAMKEAKAEAAAQCEGDGDAGQTVGGRGRCFENLAKELVGTICELSGAVAEIKQDIERTAWAVKEDNMHNLEISDPWGDMVAEDQEEQDRVAREARGGVHIGSVWAALEEEDEADDLQIKLVNDVDFEAGGADVEEFAAMGQGDEDDDEDDEDDEDEEDEEEDIENIGCWLDNLGEEREDLATYNSWLRSFLEHGNITRAMRLVDALKASGYVYDEDTYSILMEGVW